jgi:hypothetical protein
VDTASDDSGTLRVGYPKAKWWGRPAGRAQKRCGEVYVFGNCGCPVYQGSLAVGRTVSPREEMEKVGRENTFSSHTSSKGLVAAAWSSVTREILNLALAEKVGKSHVID